MIGPLATAMLNNAGLIGGIAGVTGKVLGAVGDTQRANDQAKIEQLTNDVNVANQRAAIAKNYTGIFEKMVSDLGTQNNLLATAGVDKASTLFFKSRQAHEKAFLENKANMESDINNLNVQRDLSNMQSKLTAINKKQQISTNMLGGLQDSFITWKGYGVNFRKKVEGLGK